jgi:hypothetical protein
VRVFRKANLFSSFLILVLVSMPLLASKGHTPSPSISYEQFGAKGDGKTDDLEAIVKAHAYANEEGLPVRANDKATYYIGGGSQTAIIETDTDFGSAKFIIDDREVQDARAFLFKVKSKLESREIDSIEKLSEGQKTLDVDLKESSLILITNSKKKQYIRKGGNQNSGSSQRDIILVNESGKVDPSTPVIWNFESITEIKVIPMDKKTLKITGGVFTTWPYSKVSTVYHARGFSIERSHVEVKGMKHLIEKVGKDGPPYRGFLSISKCANVNVRDTIFTGRKTYHKIGSAGTRVPMGSYAISVNTAVNVKFENCSQTNDILNRKYWGIIGNNFCKNLELDNCVFSRFDAHQGVTNATVKNSEIGYMGILAIGHGRLLVENSTVKGRNFISFRPDYGSTWNGDVIIRNSKFIPLSKGKASVLTGRNTGDHDFGYPCYLPRNVSIENLQIHDVKNKSEVAIFGDFDSRYDSKKPGPHAFIPTEKVTLKNVKAESKKDISLSHNPRIFAMTKVEVQE